MSKKKAFKRDAEIYLSSLSASFTQKINEKIYELALELMQAWMDKRQVFICGNGGSAANAIHIANDLHYGVGTGKNPIAGIRVEALSANTGTLSSG